MHPNDLLGDAKSEAEVGFVMTGFIQTVETLENRSLLVVRYAGAIVGNPVFDRIFHIDQTAVDFSAVWRIGDGIVYYNP